MHKSVFLRAAILSSVAARAFDPNGPGWKMDGDKIALDNSGNPIYVGTDGREMSVKGETVSGLQREAQNHRTAKEAAEAQLAKYRGADGKLIDPEDAAKALETVKNVNLSEMINKGELDRVREQLTGEFKSQLTEKDNAISERDNRINSMLIDGLFNGSEYIKENVAIPLEFFKNTMGKHFKVEDGKVVAYDRSGNRLMSKKAVGEFASSDEAIELLIDQHPQKDSILKDPGAGGSGNNGGGGNRGRGRTMKRSDFEALPPMQQREAAQKMGSGELTVID